MAEKDLSSPAPIGRRIALVVIVLAAGAFVFRTLAQRPERPAHAESVARPIAVRTAPLHRRAYREVLTGYGRVRSLRHTTVAAEVSGLVRWISPRLEAGAEVSEGEELVRLDDRDLVQAQATAEARLARVRAEAVRLASDGETTLKKLAVARAEFAAAKRELERIRSLQGQGSATESELDRQSMQTSLREVAVLELEGRLTALAADAKRIEAESRESDAALARARIDLGRAVIRAPYAGSIESRAVNPGARVAPGTALFELIDPKRVEVRVALPASRFGQVGVGAPARDRDGAWRGKIARIGPTVRERDRTFYVYVSLDEPPLPPPGAFVVAEIEGRLFEDVFVIPRTAVVGGQAFVANEGVAHARTPILRAELSEVLLAESGLSDGERLILTNLEEVTDGARVTAIAGSKP